MLPSWARLFRRGCLRSSRSNTFCRKSARLPLAAISLAVIALLSVRFLDWKMKGYLNAFHPLGQLMLPSYEEQLRYVPAQDDEDPQPDALGLPLPGLRLSDLRDTFNETRGAGKHGALDIIAPRGTPVLAMTTGRVAKRFTSERGGLTVYQFDRSETYCFYYAHLDHYDVRAAEGVTLRRGAVLGYVGSSGNASPSTPHLHLEISRLGPDKKWWKGTPINPFPVLQRLMPPER